MFGFRGHHGSPYILAQFVGFALFMIAMQAESSPSRRSTCRWPVELVAGYLTECSGFRFLLFFIGEYATAGAFSAIAAVLFLGGWAVPAPAPSTATSWVLRTDRDAGEDDVDRLPGDVVPKFTYPRFREDQLQIFAWKILIPISS
ncbi:MAG: NADH-quinone oxidoreductase subunit H [Acidimicrobiales bacterium]